MEVTTFAAGLITNVAEHAPRRREFSAAYCRNCRSDAQGWLVMRKGMVTLSADVAVDVFVHKSVVFAVIDSRLKWARIGFDVGDPLTFSDVDDGVVITRSLGGSVFFMARENDVYVVTGSQSWVVRVPGPQSEPTAVPFRLPPLPADALDIRVNREGDSDANRIGVYAQGVILDSSTPGYETDAIDVDSYIRSAVTPLTDKLFEFRMRDPVDFSAAEDTEIVVSLASVDSNLLDLGITHFVVYLTPYEADDPDTVSGLVPVGFVLPYRRQSDVISFNEFLRSDFVSATSDYVDAGEVAVFQYIASNNFRNYASPARSNKIYFSYYDPGANERLYRNFPDFIELDLGEGYITGLKFIRDNLLVVYATNQIQLIMTDPLAELHQVVDFISPQDDKGNRIGCVAPASIVDMGGEHYFLASNRYVYRFDSRTVRSISDAVQAIFDTVPLSYGILGEIGLLRAVGFSYEKDYFISIPSLSEDEANGYPQTTLMYDTQYRRWWQDSYGVRSISKDDIERLFAIIDDRVRELFVGTADSGQSIRRVWRSNPELRRTHDKIMSVHVYAMEPATIEVLAKTEQGEARGTIEIEQTSDVWSQRFGVNLRGRNLTVEIATESDAPIDRITTNEVFRS